MGKLILILLFVLTIAIIPYNSTAEKKEDQII